MGKNLSKPSCILLYCLLVGMAPLEPDIDSAARRWYILEEVVGAFYFMVLEQDTF